MAKHSKLSRHLFTALCRRSFVPSIEAQISFTLLCRAYFIMKSDRSRNVGIGTPIGIGITIVVDIARMGRSTARNRGQPPIDTSYNK